jgi:membrane-bound serine protease (ClpP class)
VTTRGLLGSVGLVLLCATAWSTAADASEHRRVLVTTVAGPITPVAADHLRDGLDRATAEGYQAFVVRLDTPGGLDESMRSIVKRFLVADVPVLVYVSPHGARAASAGALITLSANVAAMAPGSAIGASTPVSLEGGDVERKVIEDAAAFAESIARARGRNVELAAETVRRGRSVRADAAVDLGVADFLAPSLSAMLDQADGRVVRVGADGRPVTLHTADAQLEEYDMGLFRRVQQRLADPNLAFLFMSLGTLALVYELASPGVGGGAVVGAILILLGLFSLSVLPIDTVGLLFLALAAVLFVAELFAPGVGVAAAGGSVALVLGGIFLFRDKPGFEVAWGVLAPLAAVMGLLTVVAGRLALRVRRAPSTTTGGGLLQGRVVTVSRASGGRGQAQVDGSWWTLRARRGELASGGKVRVAEVNGIELVVEPLEAETVEREGEEA